MAIAGINFFTDYETTELLSKPSVLLTAWFLMLVVTLLPSWLVLSELVEPRAVRVIKKPT
jgi:hypothetical protein